MCPSQVSFDKNGNLVLGETSTWSNEGQCSGNILDGTTTTVFDPAVRAGQLEVTYKQLGQ